MGKAFPLSPASPAPVFPRVGAGASARLLAPSFPVAHSEERPNISFRSSGVWRMMASEVRALARQTSA